MLSFEREEELFGPVSSYKRRKSFRWQGKEVPFYDHRIDLFCFSSKFDLTVAVELKLRNWKRAIEQALVYQLCADRVFVALPYATADRVDLSRLRENGIGLIAVDTAPRCRLILQALDSHVVRAHYRDHYVETLRRAA